MASITRSVKFVRKGEQGEKGDKGAVLRGPQAWSDVPNGYSFQSGMTGEQWIDVVMYGDNYYECVTPHTKTSTNYPGSQESLNNRLWRLGDKFGIVATKLLLAEYALVKNLGVETVEMKDANGEIVFKAKDGNVVCNTGTFRNCVLDGYLQTKFTEITDQTYTLSDRLNISTFGGGTRSDGLPYEGQGIILPSDASFIGKRVCILNRNFPPYSRLSFSYQTTISVNNFLSANGIGIGGNIDADTSDFNTYAFPKMIKKIHIIGGIVELIAVPATVYMGATPTTVSRWILLTGHESIVGYE